MTRFKLLFFCYIFLVSCIATPTEQPYQHVVIFGDPHLPGNNLAAKETVRDRVNSWSDVDMIFVVGDLCALYGTKEEYAAARRFFDAVHKPFALITGNHDYIYATPKHPDSLEYHTASRAEQEEKLARFRETFALDELSSSKIINGYFFIFLSSEHPTFSAGITETQREWLQKELKQHQHLPTIIVFHSPLKDTQHPFRYYINTPHSVAQPVQTFDALIKDNPQIFLWISGHTHTPATEASYAESVNLYANQVNNIHNADMKHDTIWTNSLFLYPNHLVVRTFNHNENRWLPELDRVILPPRGSLADK